MTAGQQLLSHGEPLNDVYWAWVIPTLSPDSSAPRNAPQRYLHRYDVTVANSLAFCGIFAQTFFLFGDLFVSILRLSLLGSEAHF